MTEGIRSSETERNGGDKKVGNERNGGDKKVGNERNGGDKKQFRFRRVKDKKEPGSPRTPLRHIYICKGFIKARAPIKPTSRRRRRCFGRYIRRNGLCR